MMISKAFDFEKLAQGKYYPCVFDIDLQENMYVDRVSVFTAKSGYTQYTLYTSVDGCNFKLVANKDSCSACDAEKGDVYELSGKEARFLRVFVEYYSENIQVPLKKLCCEGKGSENPLYAEYEIYTENFEESAYNCEISEKDTIAEVFGIVERNLGAEYKAWFDFRLLAENNEFFEITSLEDKIVICGNSGVSLASGLNYYLKYFCNVHISQVGSQVNMPEKPVKPVNSIRKATKAKVRYAYNYCTFSYSMPFWGEEQWRKELDWLALNGVNVVLDITAQEEVWRRFLTKLGYSRKSIKNFITGPAYYAWAYMSNLFGFGGPVHDDWFEKRVELARKNQYIMRKLGMMPVLQGYSGMIPTDIQEYDKNIDIIPQGTWASFQRPHMIRTTSESYVKYAKLFYESQREVYGDNSCYFATDPFHEGGKTADMLPREISSVILKEMMNYRKDAVWIIQAWEGNPRSELLEGLADVENGKEHALILDLYAEKLPRYSEGEPNKVSYGYDKEFNFTPWVFCMLNNFGGRLGLHGHLDNLEENLPEAFNNCKCIKGIGITPEASGNNPVLYDYFFESIWQESSEKFEKNNLDEWIGKYIQRRYGAKNDNLLKAWMILKNTVYKAEFNQLGQGAPECIANARPDFGIKAASAWGNAVISYDKKLLEEAAGYFLGEYEALKNSECFMYDLITVFQQVLSNRAQDCYEEIERAYNRKDRNGFAQKAERFLNIVDSMEKLTSGSEFYDFEKWVSSAKALAPIADDFSQRLYEINAKALVTTWGAYNQSEAGSLHDYSNRQWSQLFGTFYKKRWELWLKQRADELEGKESSEFNWFEWEWSWVRNCKISTVCHETDRKFFENILAQ